MKLLHLSDLHIGKRVNEFSMLEDQIFILTQILQLVERERPDAVLICGDVYDKSMPSAEAVSLFDDFLFRLAKKDTQVLIISGNHDSPERLAFGNRLMEGAGIHISSAYNGQTQCVTLKDGEGEVCFWLLPFVKPAHVKRFYPDKNIESYTDACRVAVEQMNMDTAKRNVLLCHQFVTGASVDPDGSEEISVGGSENVDASVFADFDYVALGHIHGQQNISDSNRIRYCGTPLKYSFSEEHHHKSVTIVELGAKGQRKLDLYPLTPKHDMRTITGAFDAVMAMPGTEDYLRVILTDEDDVHEAMNKLRVIYPNIMELKYDNTRTRANQTIDGAERVEEKTPLQLFEELFELQNNQSMNDEQRSFVTELLEKLQEDAR